MNNGKSLSHNLFKSLRNVSQSNAEGLQRRKRILEIQRVSVAIDPTKLHNLSRKKEEIKINCFSLDAFIREGFLLVSLETRFESS